MLISEFLEIHKVIIATTEFKENYKKAEEKFFT